MIAFSISVLSKSGQPGTLLSPPLIALAAGRQSDSGDCVDGAVLAPGRHGRARRAAGWAAGGCTPGWSLCSRSSPRCRPCWSRSSPRCCSRAGSNSGSPTGRGGCSRTPSHLARSTYDQEVQRVANETVTMAGDVAGYLREVSIDDPRFAEAFARQVYVRNLSEAAIINVGPDRQIRTHAVVNPYDRPLERIVTPAGDRRAYRQAERVDQFVGPDRRACAARVSATGIYIYSARVFDPQFREQISRADEVLERLSRPACAVARQPVAVQRRAAGRRPGHRRPGDLHRARSSPTAWFARSASWSRAAGRVEEGRFFDPRSGRSDARTRSQTLATAFNRMTGRLEEQTGALMAANSQLDTRRAFIEAVLSSVTAGVIALDDEQAHPAHQPLGRGAAPAAARNAVEGSNARRPRRPSSTNSCRGDQREADRRWSASARGQRTLAVKRVRYQDGRVLTFDDITDQLRDQRRAAWSDIARRIAHEIKNPLTPIQLAAERLQRRYRQGNRVRPRHVRAADRDDRPPGRRPAADGRRILLLRAHAQAGVPRRECPRHRPPGPVPARGRAPRRIASRSTPRARRRSAWSATAASSARR